MKRAVVLVMFGVAAILSASVQGAGHGEVVLKMNGGDNLAYIGEDNTWEVWIKNDATLSSLELSFGFKIDCDATFPFGEEFRTASIIEAFDDYSTYVTISGMAGNVAGATDTVELYFAFLGGASDMGLPVHDTLTLCYYLVWEVDSEQEELANGLKFDNIAFDANSSWPIGGRCSWSFTDHSGEYAPDYNGFQNESVENPTAPAVSFHVVNRDRSQCCNGLVGDVNGSGDDTPTIGDGATLIDHLFITGGRLFCIAEADINQSGGTDPQEGPDGDISIGDVSHLIDHLFISGTALPSCF